MEPICTSRIILEYIKTLIWPTIVLILMFWYRQDIGYLLKNVKKLRLPGGTFIETFPQVLEEAKNLSVKVIDEIKVADEERMQKHQEKHPQIPLNEANARMLNLGLAPSPSGLELSYYQILAEQDPNLALAGLRMEAEIMLKNVARGFKVLIGDRDSAGIIARKLQEHNTITIHQFELINSVLKLCNAAVHGQKITEGQAAEVLDVFAVLRDHYMSWLSWGFDD